MRRPDRTAICLNCDAVLDEDDADDVFHISKAFREILAQPKMKLR